MDIARARHRAWRLARRLKARHVLDSRAELHEFWRNPGSGNHPADYLPPVGRSEALRQLLSGTPPEAALLEIGCNVGRNLAYLHDHGYQHLAGVEINEDAVRLLRQRHPQLADTPIHIGAAEDVLPRLQPVDVVFTMAVLEHIHPSSAVVFDQIARLAPDVLAIEPSVETTVITHRQFPHDLQTIFAERGFEMRDRYSMSAFPECPEMQRYWAYRFDRAAG